MRLAKRNANSIVSKRIPMPKNTKKLLTTLLNIDYGAASERLINFGNASAPKKGARMAEELKTLIHEYETGGISRREFMRQAVIATGSLAAANSLIGGLVPKDSDAAQVAPNDPDLLTHYVSYAV